MKVLFVSGGNQYEDGKDPLIMNQGNSLSKEGIEMDYFWIKGKGAKGYLKNIPILKDYLKKNKIDLVHAHYSYCGYVAGLASSIPVVVSLLGSDVHSKNFWRVLIRTFSLTRWNATIVKSGQMKELISLSNANVIPNGVNFEKFRPIDQHKAREKVGFSHNKKHIIFVIDFLDRPEKNFKLVKDAYELLDKEKVELNVVSNVPNELIPYYMNAADVLVLSSLWEGSPNVIKESMACNCPIVSTDVGDVKEVFGDTEGCFITSYDAKETAEKIQKALDFGKRTEGRKNIDYLNSVSIAQKIIKIYKKVLKIND